MELHDIVRLPFTQLKKHINLLDDEYNRRTGRRVCRSCSGDVQFMINYLKNLETMSKFEFKSSTAIYRVDKQKQARISQSNLTDESAVEYISLNPERISLFKKYPDNWQELIGLTTAEVVDDCCDDDTDVPCDDCMRLALEKLTLRELKIQYPEIPLVFAMKKMDFIDSVIEMKSK